MGKEDWLISVMIGFGRSAQFLMTDCMGHCEAHEYAKKLIRRIEDDHWIEVSNTYINPKCITTIRVVKKKEYQEGGV